MQTTEYLKTIINELDMGASILSEQEAEQLVEDILSAEKVFVAGGGRSGFAAKSFAMRMIHVGLDAYVVGETVTPNYEDSDLLIICSGSGETKGLVSIAEKAKNIGGKIVSVTTSPDSTIAGLADSVIQMPGSPKDQSNNTYQTIQPMGSLFEQTLLLFFDAVILRFMERKGLDSHKMYGRHANLE
ncbi:6-phospho-3-hexuloisomerase [Sediminibacillus massiliensis]|uniref:6-phospho-3-hexuloisomerase n=1 Tax=Sediminibacillus massiliensis TaxID=1926277 RepID=UPI000988510D|nr:6-phospho-3-hexuloisomerase [Sediminibacillus massiliensis]